MSRLGFASPGVGSQLNSQANQFLWGGSRCEILQLDFQIDSAALDAGSNNTHVLRPGMMLGRITATGKLKEFDVAASDGSQILTGFAPEEMPLITTLGTAQDAFAPIVVRAPVKAKRILYKGVTIIGHASEEAIREQIRTRFHLDDEFNTVPSRSGSGLVLNTRQRFTIAQVNAGATVLAAVPLKKYRMIHAQLIAIGGAVGATTTVDIIGTQSASPVKLLAGAQANLTQNTVIKDGATGGAVLAGGLSYVQNDVNTPITIGKTSSDITTATHIDVSIDYELAP